MLINWMFKAFTNRIEKLKITLKHNNNMGRGRGDLEGV